MTIRLLPGIILVVGSRLRAVVVATTALNSAHQIKLSSCFRVLTKFKWQNLVSLRHCAASALVRQSKLEMNEKFTLADYVNDIHMEVGCQYFPLPVIPIPKEDIALRVPLYKYSFTAEQQFFDYISKNDFSAVSSSNKTQEETASAIPTTSKTLSDTCEDVIPNGKNAYELLQMVEFPTPSPLTTDNIPNRSKQVDKPKERHHELAEFEEHGKSVFDLMELKCIDEKAELETLWNSCFTNK